jgi:hypothetical protein
VAVRRYSRPFLNPYTLWWEYDKIGFGLGVGRAEGGHTLRQARLNTKFSLEVGYRDLFGWLRYSWIFLPIGLLAILVRRNWLALLVAGVPVSLVLVFLAYWVGSWLFGPATTMSFLCPALVSAPDALAGWPARPDERANLFRMEKGSPLEWSPWSLS